MENIRVDKKQLINDLKKNLGKHRAIFDQAVEGYKVATVPDAFNKSTILRGFEQNALGASALMAFRL